MDITWHGNTCFSLKEKGVSLIIDPDKDSGKLKGDVVLSSLKEGETAEVEGVEKVFTWPGEYEVKDIPIIGFRAWTESLSEEEEKGHKGEPTIIYYFQMGNFKVCHLGELGHILSSDMIKKIGDVDILIMKVGEGSNLKEKKATEILEAIDPRCFVPMGNGQAEKFIKDLGAEEGLEAVEKFTLKSASELPDDKRQYVLLKKS